MDHDFVIVADWGTSCLRAFLCKLNIEENLKVIDSFEGSGVKTINGQFEEYLLAKIDHWRQAYGNIPLILSGQIGSSIGWKETRYLACPISPAALADSCLSFKAKEHPIYIVPGVSFEKSGTYPDVMRGEELQVLGWLQLDAKHKIGKHLLCLPGTHTKWVYVEDGEIKHFKTAMTGELFDMLTNHSILIQQKSTHFSTEHFLEGIECSKINNFSSLLNDLFSVRSKQLFGELNEDTSMSYLSGILIGSDVKAAINMGMCQMNEFDKVVIIGATKLSQHFSQALSKFSIESQLYDVTQASLAGYYLLCTNLFGAKATTYP